MKQFLFMLAAAVLASCGELIPVDPTTNPESTEALCDDVTWLESTRAAMSKQELKWEIHTNIYKGVRVFELTDCISDRSDAMTVVYDCSGKLVCQFGGITGMNTCPDYPFDSENRALLWHN